ncbi:hypothetical protein C8F01DRAFT_1121574 [Mycena amicta]|nr:hypothetical protein C8F01DRAFT_1121574 [Mycena amicta]
MHTDSPRLILREITVHDIENIYALDSIPENARYQTWPPRTREEVGHFVEENIH